MAKKKPYLYKTTIQVTGSLIDVYDRLVARYGVSTTVSAGIAIMDSLSAEEREQWIDRVKELCACDKNLHEVSEKAQAKKLLADVSTHEAKTRKKKPGRSAISRKSG